MPSDTTVFRYLQGKSEEHIEFREQYARALMFRTYYLAEEALDISRDDSQDTIERQQGQNTVRIGNSTAVASAPASSATSSTGTSSVSTASSTGSRFRSIPTSERVTVRSSCSSSITGTYRMSRQLPSGRPT